LVPLREFITFAPFVFQTFGYRYQPTRLETRTEESNMPASSTFEMMSVRKRKVFPY